MYASTSASSNRSRPPSLKARDWLSEIARIAKGDHLETTVTEEFDAAGNLKTRTTRTATSRSAWQAYAWLLERRHLEKWARTRGRGKRAECPRALLDTRADP